MERRRMGYFTRPRSHTSERRTSRHKGSWLVALATGIACICLLSFYCSWWQDSQQHRTHSLLHGRLWEEESTQGQRIAGSTKQLWLKHNGLADATQEDIISQAALAAKEQKIGKTGHGTAALGARTATSRAAEWARGGATGHGGQFAGLGAGMLAKEDTLEPGDSSGDNATAEVAAKVVLELVQQSERLEAQQAQQSDASEAQQVQHSEGLEAKQDMSSSGGDDGGLTAEETELAAQAAAEDARMRAEESIKESWRNVEALNQSLLIEEDSRIYMPKESRFEGLERDPSKCPLQYDRLTYEGVQKYWYYPYIMGERAKPMCKNCERDNIWSHFCQFESGGRICQGWLKWELISGWINRTDQGAPGIEEMMTFTPCDLFPYVRGRTLWLIGDSQTLELDKAIKCFMYEFWDLEIRHLIGRLPKPAKNFQGWCAHMAQGAKICFLRANRGTDVVNSILPILPALGAKTTDIMVVNFALWINDGPDYRRNVSYFIDYYKAHKKDLPMTLWRDSPVQHFQTETGDYQWPIPGDSCAMIQGLQLRRDNSLHALVPSSQVMAEGGWRNKIALPYMHEAGIPVINTWNQSVPMWQYHQENDCTHSCHPSVYQYWVFELYRTLKSLFPELSVST